MVPSLFHRWVCVVLPPDASCSFQRWAVSSLCLQEVFSPEFVDFDGVDGQKRSRFPSGI